EHAEGRRNFGLFFRVFRHFRVFRVLLLYRKANAPQSEKYSCHKRHDPPRLIRLVSQPTKIPTPDGPERQGLDGEQDLRPDQTAPHTNLRRNRIQARTSSAESISSHSSGSGMVGTAPDLTGSSPAR